MPVARWPPNGFNVAPRILLRYATEAVRAAVAADL